MGLRMFSPEREPKYICVYIYYRRRKQGNCKKSEEWEGHVCVVHKKKGKKREEIELDQKERILKCIWWKRDLHKELKTEL